MMRFRDRYSTWDDALAAWDEQSRAAGFLRPLKRMKSQPAVPSITSKARRFLKLKTFWYLMTHDEGGIVRHHVRKRPLRYGWRLVRSWFSRRPYQEIEDLFYYGTDPETFEKDLQNRETLLVLGFSYCHKPFECPSKRFTDGCMADTENSVCQQCFIGQCVHARPQDSITYFVPTVHYIGKKILELVEAHPNKKIIFIITACEMTLKMFADWGNMTGIQGVGVRLGGRVCNTLEAFKLSEKGVKPGLTLVNPESKKQVLEYLRQRDSLET